MGIRFPCAAGVRCVIGGASGKSAKRRQRRMKRAGFEEVPRLAATTVEWAGIGWHDGGQSPPPTTRMVGGAGGDTDVPVAVPKIFALPYGGRLKF